RSGWFAGCLAGPGPGALRGGLPVRARARQGRRPGGGEVVADGFDCRRPAPCHCRDFADMSAAVSTSARTWLWLLCTSFPLFCQEPEPAAGKEGDPARPWLQKLQSEDPVEVEMGRRQLCMLQVLPQRELETLLLSP